MPHLVGDLRNSSQGERTTKYGNRLALTVCLTLVASTCFAAPSFAQNLIPVVKPRALPYRNKAVLLHAWVTGLAFLPSSARGAGSRGKPFAPDASQPHPLFLSWRRRRVSW